MKRFSTVGLHAALVTILTGVCGVLATSVDAQSFEARSESNGSDGAAIHASDSHSATVDFPAESIISSDSLGPDLDAQQEAATEVSIVTAPHREKVEQEVIIEGLVSYGNYKIFASGYDDKLFTAGVEYDRHSWGHLLKAHVDYVAEVLPFVLLDRPVHVDKYGNPNPVREKNIRELVPGVGISPLGFRLQWRSNTAIKPYLELKGGMLGFTKKVPAMEATYENFSLQSAMGVQIKMNEHWGLRLGLFSDFHFSNAFIVDSNPGLDVMNANLGVSYHF